MKYRDKNDIPVLPDIPDHFDDELIALVDDFNTTLEDPLFKLRKIYKFIDSYGKFVDTFSVCSKGCAHCCSIDVSTTLIEAELISHEIGKEINLKAFSYGNASPCPFIGNNNECTIYNVRPFHCRIFYTLDNPLYCKTNEQHQVYGYHSGQYANKFYKIGADLINLLNRNRGFSDIRDFFKL